MEIETANMQIQTKSTLQPKVLKLFSAIVKNF